MFTTLRDGSLREWPSDPGGCGSSDEQSGPQFAGGDRAHFAPAGADGEENPALSVSPSLLFLHNRLPSQPCKSQSQDLFGRSSRLTRRMRVVAASLRGALQSMTLYQATLLVHPPIEGHATLLQRLQPPPARCKSKEL